jgi:hypothetical protein
MMDKLEPASLNEAVDKVSETHKQINREIEENYKNQVHVFTEHVNDIQEKAIDFGIAATDFNFEYAKLLLALRKAFCGI